MNTFESIKLYIAAGLTSDGKPNCVIDDVYIADEQGDINNDFLGDVAIECYFPEREGTYKDFGSSIDKVQAVTDHIDDTYLTYALDATPHDKQTFIVSPVYDATPSYSVKGVVEWTKLASDPGYKANFVMNDLESAATPLYSGESATPLSRFQWYGHPWELSNDATPVPLTPTIINNSEFGIRGINPS